jgi:signal transduction histidine kinase
VQRLSVRFRSWTENRSPRRGLLRAARGFTRVLAASVVWWLSTCRAAARRERDRIGAQRGQPIPIAYRPLVDASVPTLRVMAGDPATWRDLLHLLIAPAYAALAALLIGGALAGGVTAISVAVSGYTWNDPEMWWGLAGGAGLLLALPVLVHVAARGAAGLGAALLATGESARMRAELDEQRLRRQLAVDAAERERRRIERDLHDGAQQRLVALGISLGMAREALPEDPEAGARLVEEAHAEAKLALAELRDLARGIHPAILGDRGLDAALSELVRRTPTPVSIIVLTPRRPPASVESTAYFVVAEALTNVTRHAGASRATVQITQGQGLFLVEVSDDGVGGADPGRGTGLSGLADRVGALNGRLEVDSPAGGPTTIRAEIPCAW